MASGINFLRFVIRMGGGAEAFLPQRFTEATDRFGKWMTLTYIDIGILMLGTDALESLD